MKQRIPQQKLNEIQDLLYESIAGYSGFISWVMGEIEEEIQDPAEDIPWKAAFLLFAGKGKVATYRQVLLDNGYPVKPELDQLIESQNQEVDRWLEQSYNEVMDQFEQAYLVLATAYQKSYLDPLERGLGWSVDDFLDERDMLEFFLIGAEGLLPVTEFQDQMMAKDLKVQSYFHQIGMDNLQEFFFPDRREWLPDRFWWQHGHRV